MNISRAEQRTLHILAQGGLIEVEKDGRGKITRADCRTREGWMLSDCTLGVFQRLRRRGLIASIRGLPYRITRRGLTAVRPRLDNR